MREQDEPAGALRHDEVARRAAGVDLLLVRQSEEPLHLVVGDLAEVVVPESHGVERVRSDQPDELVHLRPELVQRVRRRGRNGHDDALGLPAADGRDRGPHRRPRREAVVDEHDRPVPEVGRRPLAPVGLLAADKLRLLSLRHPFGSARRRVSGSRPSP